MSRGIGFLMPLGKGFFSLKFHLHEDQLKVARQSSWKLTSGSIQIRQWKPNFDPYKELSSTAQIWVRLFHLPAEYWHPEFLVGIFRAVGNVIKLDGNTAHGLVGHFARALVEIDLNNPLLDSVRVGLPDNLFYVDFSYENIPLLCTYCNFVGHSADKCRKAKAAAKESDKTMAKGDEVSSHTELKRSKKKWTPKSDKGKEVAATSQDTSGAVYTTNPFTALQNIQEADEEDAFVPETQDPPNQTDQRGSDENRHKHTPSTDENIQKHTPSTAPATTNPSNWIDLVTVPADENGPAPISSTIYVETKRRIIEQAKELTRVRKLRSEIAAPKSTDVPASMIGQPRVRQFAPNSPHPAAVSVNAKLQEAVDMGKQPTAYELHPGNSAAFKGMDRVATQRWSDIAQDDNSKDSDDNDTGETPIFDTPPPQ